MRFILSFGVDHHMVEGISSGSNITWAGSGVYIPSFEIIIAIQLQFNGQLDS